MRQFSDDDKRVCAERELKWRRRVYPRRIDTGRMKQKDAEREIALMEEIAQDYKLRTELPL